jgi:hypothetical protein
MVGYGFREMGLHRIQLGVAPFSSSGPSGFLACTGDPPVANTGLEAAARRSALSIVISDGDIQPLVADLFRVRIPTATARALNCYLRLGPDGVTVVDTGWADSAPVIARALELVGRRTSDVERIVLSHFHDDHVGSAATVAQWSPSTVVAGRADTPFIRGVEPGHGWACGGRARTQPTQLLTARNGRLACCRYEFLPPAGELGLAS